VIVGASHAFGDLKPESAQDLRDHTWLTVPGSHEAADWLAQIGLSPADAPKQRVTAPHDLRDALRLGVGLAALPLLTVRDDLNSGRLVELFREETASNFYALSRQDATNPNTQTFLRWLVAGAQKS
jgi:DNA-binding transcriptional LysR family regulator